MDSTPVEMNGVCMCDPGEPQGEHWPVNEQLEESIVQGSCEYEEISAGSPYICEQEVDIYEEEEIRALDLRIIRASGELDLLKVPKWNSRFNKPNRETDHIYYEPIINDSLQQKMTFNDPHFYNKSEFLMYDTASIENSATANDYSTGGGSVGNDFKCEKFLCDCSTNTDPTIMVDCGTQTEHQDRKDETVQTDPLAEFLTLRKAPVKYTCTVCKRLYAAKSSYERHLKTHMTTSDKCHTYVRFTTEAKLQVYKRQEVTKYKPIIIQMPQAADHQCTLCNRICRSRLELDGHDCTPELPLTKCPQCPYMFYTSGGLQDHISKAHKKTSSADNSYYCVFCGENLQTDYKFHLHLDKHLSS